MKPLSNIKEHIFLLLDLINLILRDNNLNTEEGEIDTNIAEKIISRLDNSKNSKLVGDNARIKDDLISYVNKLIGNINGRSIPAGTLALEVLNILSDEFDTELVKNSFTENPDDKSLVNDLRYKLNDYVAREEIKSTMKKAIYDMDNTTSLKLNTILETTLGKLDGMFVEDDSEHVSMEITGDDIEGDKLDLLGSKADEAINKKIYKTGFQDLNNMLQGGLRAGQFTTVGALPSNFKTGLNIRFFQDIATLNKPTIWEDGKKSALVWLSFEDPLGTTMVQMYKSLHMDEFGKDPDTRNMTSGEIFKAVLSKLKANGWHVIFKKIDASDWSYRGLFKELETIEKQGYRIESLTLDYLPHIPTTGCINNNGAIGAPLRELVRRIAQYCERRDILLMTPLQLSTSAKKLLQNGVEDYEFVKKLPNKGYYADSGQLDQEIFLELFTHIFKLDGKAYLTIQRGKHKIPSFIDERDKYIILPLPRRGYTKSDLNEEKSIGFRDIEEVTSGSTGGVFDF